MTDAKVLHLLPRCTGAGPERSLLATVDYAPDSTRKLHHTVAVLDVPVASSMYLAARRSGLRVMVQPDDDELRKAAADADVVVVHYWNHPLLLTTLGRVDLGATRMVVWSMVLGLHRPQVLDRGLGDFADILVLTTERSSTSEGARTAGIVRTVPGIADMGRLDSWRPVHHDGVEVGYVGVVAPTKMHPHFAELCAGVRDRSVRFTVVGAGGGERRLQHRAAELGLADRLVCTGYTDDIASALGTFDVFGYPLCVDTYATSEKALQEAMWVGIPPVVFPHGGLADLVEDGVTGVVVDSEDEYPAAIDRLAGDHRLRRRLGTDARRVARDRFDPHTLAARWAEVIDLALTLPRRQRPLLHPGLSGSALFAAAMGDQAGPFRRSLDAPDDRSIDAEIAGSSPLVIGGDGGLVHYRNTWPEDRMLGRWVDIATANRHADDPGAGLSDQ